MPCEIITIPLLSNNYGYLILSENQTAVIDPADARPVIRWLKQHNRLLNTIICTHHHGDHCDGNNTLKKKYGSTIYGPDDGRIPGLDHGLLDEKEFSIGETSFRVMLAPGHTRSHIAIYSSTANAVFTGDALFSCGCGRLFEGSAAQMWDSLKKLRSLPDSTLIYPGHEYTEDNIRFALTVDPHNLALIARSHEVAMILQDGRPSIPVTLAIEKATNPFLRADEPVFARQLGMEGMRPEEVFAGLRGMKDRFR